MTSNSIASQRRQEVLKRLEEGYKRVRDSDRFKEWLSVSARFHRYSAHNTMLIWLQRPDATRIAGFHTWRKLGRGVRLGEKGIQILAPQPYKRVETDENGDEEEVEGIYFKTVYVFDIAQTDGRDLPEPVDELEGDDAGLYDRLAAVAMHEGLSLDRTPGRNATANGFYSPMRREIWVCPDLPAAQSAKTLAHELAHHYADHASNGHCEGERETIAEASAYMVMAHHGIEADGFSFGYLAAWTDDKTFKARLAEIQKVAGTIIAALEKTGQAR